MGGTIQTSVRFLQLYGAISFLVFNKIVILRHSFQPHWWIFTNWSQSNVEKTVYWFHWMFSWTGKRLQKYPPNLLQPPLSSCWMSQRLKPSPWQNTDNVRFVHFQGYFHVRCHYHQWWTYHWLKLQCHCVSTSTAGYFQQHYMAISRHFLYETRHPREQVDP